MRKITKSVLLVIAVAAVAAYATYSFFSDTETSTGNTFTAGAIDLKVDHLRETYNGVDCNTCNLTLISDTSNTVIKKNGAPVTSYPAVFVGSQPPFFIHSAWTAQNDPDLVAAGAKWIWESDPTRDEDTRTDVTYTFEKKFEWYGPVLSSDLWFGVGSDNSIKVWLNGNLIAENTMEFGYQQGNMLHIPAAVVNSLIAQGNNVLTFEVKNWALLNPPGTPYNNPAGLIYKFFISGNCQDNYFKQHCTLFGEKDLTNGDHFWNFDDVKPGDHGTNVISLHVNSNDAYVCMRADNVQNLENDRIDPEIAAGDTTDVQGELSQYLNLFVWEDLDGDGVYDRSGETALYSGNFDGLNGAINRLAVAGSGSDNYGVAWCVGNQTVNHSTGEISCDGTGDQNKAQTDKTIANLVFYAVQQRNNSGFSCSSVNHPVTP
jgi:predicted ribosomally synthesized peptide with SipW-like signal peptide